MLCYRDQSWCADQDQCATPDSECFRRLTERDNEIATSRDIPIAWMSFKNTCRKYQEKAE